MAGYRPSNYVQTFTVTVPAGTAKASPATFSTPIHDGEVVGVDVVIPTGHAGLTGLQLYLAGALMLPAVRGEWISGNGENLEIPTAGYPETGAWSVQAYNLGVYPHSFLVRFYVNTLAQYQRQLQEEQAPEPIPTPLLV